MRIFHPVLRAPSSLGDALDLRRSALNHKNLNGDKSMKLFGRIVCVLAVGSAAEAAVFVNPPEFAAPEWETTAPYQRDIYFNFAVRPATLPTNGIQGASYSGTLDPILKLSDTVSGGASLWHSSLSGFSRTGLFGLDNRSGNFSLNATVTFHIANTEALGPEKHVWLEYEFYTSPGTNVVFFSVAGPGGKEWPQLGGDPYQYIGDEFFRGNLEFGASPNPEWETITVHFYAEPGGAAFLDKLHIATECVPEPSVLALVFLGMASLMFRFTPKR
jgi:hypothetical protein